MTYVFGVHASPLISVWACFVHVCAYVCAYVCKVCKDIIASMVIVGGGTSPYMCRTGDFF